jgi:hypothetical protein
VTTGRGTFRAARLGGLALVVLGCARAAVEGPTATAPRAPAPADGEAFQDLARGAVAQRGFLDLYQKQGRIYLAVPRSQLEQDFLLGFQIAQGIGVYGLNGGAMLSAELEPAVVALERRAETVYLVRRPVHHRARPGSPLQRAVALSFGSSVLDVARVVATRPDSAVVVDITGWLTSDLAGVGDMLARSLADSTARPAGSSDAERPELDTARSFVEWAKVFPDNIELDAKLTFVSKQPNPLPSVPDPRFISLAIHYTMARLPAVPMAPRQADDRVGYFTSSFKDFSRGDDTYFTWYVNRWRLECSEQTSNGLCVPRKPIVFYIDRTVPEAYRPALAAGVANWARAFEAAGFKDAIRAEPLPDGADPADIRYPTIRWITSDERVYGAMAPFLADPRTGEILDADILIEASAVQQSLRWLEDVLPRSEGIARLAAEQSALLRVVLAARGEIGPDDPVPPAVAGALLTSTTMHEVGHTLGLRHNFRASTDTPLERLSDSGWIAQHGLTSSVMEYAGLNLGSRGHPSRSYFNPGVGSADRWAIAYGYVPDSARAAALAREGALAGHAFATDEYGDSTALTDPTVNRGDLSDDPLAWAKERAQLIRELWSGLADRPLPDNASYARLTETLRGLLSQYARTVGLGVRYVGGMYQFQDHVGDPKGRPPFAPVPKATQRAALRFVEEFGFAEGAFEVPRPVLARLGADSREYWGEPRTFGGRIDFPFSEQVLAAQKALLGPMLHPVLFARMRDAEARFGADSVLTIPEYLDRLTRALWSEVYGSGRGNIAARRRDLQRTYLDRLAALVVKPPVRLPADARSVARWQLGELRRHILGRLARGGLADYTRAHLSESRARIDQALRASLAAE